MNKKIATFIFAIGLGATAIPAFASCYSICATEWRACVASGTDSAECSAELSACQAGC